MMAKRLPSYGLSPNLLYISVGAIQRSDCFAIDVNMNTAEPNEMNRIASNTFGPKIKYGTIFVSGNMYPWKMVKEKQKVSQANGKCAIVFLRLISAQIYGDSHFSKIIVTMNLSTKKKNVKKYDAFRTNSAHTMNSTSLSFQSIIFIIIVDHSMAMTLTLDCNYECHQLEFNQSGRKV